MNNLRAPLVLIAFLAFILQGCAHNPYQMGDHFNLEREGAVMPVQVAGNVESGIFLIASHGGPGATDAFYTRHESFQNLQKDFAIVYWDQRMSGMSGGEPTDASLTVDGFVKDLEMLVDTVRKRYSVKRLVLFGHSWGGALGTAYLLDKKRQAKVDAWIEMNGAHDAVQALVHSRKWVLEQAKTLSKQDNSDASDWQETVEWYAEHPVIDAQAFAQHVVYLKKAKGYFYDADIENSFVGFTLAMALEKPSAAFTIFRDGQDLLERLEVDKISLTSKMHQITLPTLFLWGRFDHLVPIEVGHEGFDALGTEDSKKKFMTFEKSGHILFMKEPKLFEEAVRSFVLRGE